MECLIGLYPKAGYELWVKGPEDVEGSVTVNGRLVGMELYQLLDLSIISAAIVGLAVLLVQYSVVSPAT